MSTDTDWQAWGVRDPYFGVLAHERFRRERLTPESFEEFFRSGREEISEILADCRRHVGELVTQRTLEFGCGVGRLLIPLSEISGLCVGVDISAAMREEAALNCTRFGRSNVQLVRSLHDIAGTEGGFTFIYSYIVLQHIDPERGLDIVATLLRRLDKGGCAALHLTYGRSKYRNNLGAQPLGRRLARRIRRPLSRLSRRIGNRDPEMQMNAYDMNRVLFLAQQQGVTNGGFRFTDHAGHLGVILFLKRD
jgi:SAM-dependent methyltransferase